MDPIFRRNIDDVHDILDDIQEQNEIADEISTALSAPVGFDAGIDEVYKIYFVSIWAQWIVHTLMGVVY